MNDENQITQYEMVKNVTPYAKKRYRSWVEVSLFTDRNLFHHCTLAKNAVLDTPEYTCTNSAQTLGTFSRLNDPWFGD